MLRIIVLLLLAGSIHSLQAQLITFGPKGGLNYSKIVVDKTFTSEGTDFSYATREARVGLMFGAFGRLKIGPVFFQPELLFSQDKTDIQVSSINFDEVQTLTVNKLDMPLLAGVRLGKTFKVMGGPVKTFIRNSKVDSPTDMWESYQANKDDATWGYQLGAGLDIGRFMVEARYEGSFGGFTNEVTLGNQTYTFDHRPHILQLSLGIMLIK